MAAALLLGERSQPAVACSLRIAACDMELDPREALVAGCFHPTPEGARGRMRPRHDVLGEVPILPSTLSATVASLFGRFCHLAPLPLSATA